MSSESKQSKQSKVTLMVEDNAPQGSSCLRNTCSTVNGSMSFSGCSLGVTNSTVALDSSTTAVDQHLMYAKLSTRSATTSVQFNFDANGAMYRSTTICVEEATIRENSGDSLLFASGGGGSSSSVSAPPPPPPALLSSGAQENLFATFRPLSTDDDDEGPPVMNRTRSVARSDSHEDPLTYFSPTVSMYVVEPKEAISISLSGGGPAPSYSKEDEEEDDEDDEDEDGLHRHHHHEGPLSRGPLVSLSSTDHCHVSQQGSSSKGNPLDP